MKVLLNEVKSFGRDYIARVETAYQVDGDGKWISYDDENFKLENKVMGVAFFERVGFDSTLSVPVRLSRTDILNLAAEINRIESVPVPDGQPTAKWGCGDDEDDLPF